MSSPRRPRRAAARPVLVSERPAIGSMRAVRTAGLSEEELAGGLHLVLARRASVPMVELRFAFPLPGDLVGKRASAMVLAKSLLAGTDAHDRTEIASALQRIGGSLSVNASGDWIGIAGSALTERLGDLLGIVAEILGTATYPSREVSADRGRLAEEIAIALSQPQVLAGEQLRRRLHPGHPYSAGLPRPEVLERVSAPSLRRSHARAFTPSCGHLVLVGDVTRARALRAIRALEPWLAETGAGPPGRLSPLVAVPPVPLGPLELVDRPGAVQSNLRIGRLAPGRSDAMWPAASLANQVFGGMFASRLVENLRERNGYSYSPGSSIEHRRAGSSFVLQADVATASTAAALIETYYELGRIVTQGITPDELESAQRYGLGTLSYSTATQAGLASTLVSLAVNGIDLGYLGRHSAALAKATRDEVNQAAGDLLGPAQMVAVVVGDASVVARSIERVSAVEVGG